MGCANAKQSLEDAIDELKVNPTTGLVNLQRALAQAEKDSTQQESVKAKLPRIFETLPKAMECLRGSIPETLAACSVVECCAKICNDPCLGGPQVVIAGEAIKECQCHLIALLKKHLSGHNKSLINSQSSPGDKRQLQTWDHIDNQAKRVQEAENSSKVVKAVAVATIALLILEANTTECKHKLVSLGGIVVALKAVQSDSSRVAIKTKEALALMLSLFADTPESVAIVVAHGGTYALTSYVNEPEKYDVSKDMHSHCVTVLKACLAHGENVQKEDKIQAAINSSQSS